MALPPPFITSDLTRRHLESWGVDPDDPQVRANMAGRYVGEQPAEGPVGWAQSFGAGALRSVVNTGAGVADLLPALGRTVGLTDYRVPTMRPFYVEEANPASSALGQVAGTIAQFAAGAGAVGALGRAGKLGQAIGRLEEAGALASRGLTRLGAMQEAAGIPFGNPASLISYLGGEEKARAAVQGIIAGSRPVGGLLSGFEPAAVASRALHGAVSFGAFEGLQPTEEGGIEERFKNAWHGMKIGAIQSSVAAPAGTLRAVRAVRGALGAQAAFGNEQMVPGPVPAWVQNTAFGVFDALGRTLPERKPPGGGGGGTISRATGRAISEPGRFEPPRPEVSPGPPTIPGSEHLHAFLDSVYAPRTFTGGEVGVARTPPLTSPGRADSNPVFVALAARNAQAARAAEGRRPLSYPSAAESEAAFLDEGRSGAPGASGRVSGPEMAPAPGERATAEARAWMVTQPLAPQVTRMGGGVTVERRPKLRTRFEQTGEFRQMGDVGDILSAARWRAQQRRVEEMVVEEGKSPVQAQAEVRGDADAVAINSIKPEDPPLSRGEQEAIVQKNAAEVEAQAVNARNAEVLQIERLLAYGDAEGETRLAALASQHGFAPEGARAWLAGEAQRIRGEDKAAGLGPPPTARQEVVDALNRTREETLGTIGREGGPPPVPSPQASPQEWLEYSKAYSAFLDGVAAKGERTLRIPLTKDPKASVVISRGTDPNQLPWRVTNFDGDIPTGHTEAKTFRDALNVARDYNPNWSAVEEGASRPTRMGVAPENPGLIGRETRAFGPDPNETFGFRLRVMNMDDVQASNLGDGKVNPDWKGTHQPRNRTDKKSQMWVEDKVKQAVPDYLLTDIPTLDDGIPIVHQGNVESGSGRTMVLKRLVDERPDTYAEYKRLLVERAESLGLDPAEVAKIERPMLVRERTADMSPAEAKRFAEIANERATLKMDPSEQAMVDADRISDSMIARLEVGESQSIDDALSSSVNADVIREFRDTLPDTEKNTAEKDLLPRVKAALLARLFNAEDGLWMMRQFSDTLDSGVKAVENALYRALPQLAQAEAAIRTGARHANLSFTKELGEAVRMLFRLREEGISILDHLSQGSLFERDSPFIEGVLKVLWDNRRSSKGMADTFRALGARIMQEPIPGQADLFGREPRQLPDLLRAAREDVGQPEADITEMIRREVERQHAKNKKPPETPGSEEPNLFGGPEPTAQQRVPGTTPGRHRRRKMGEPRPERPPTPEAHTPEVQAAKERFAQHLESQRAPIEKMTPEEQQTYIERHMGEPGIDKATFRLMTPEQRDEHTGRRLSDKESTEPRMVMAIRRNLRASGGHPIQKAALDEMGDLKKPRITAGISRGVVRAREFGIETDVGTDGTIYVKDRKSGRVETAPNRLAALHVADRLLLERMKSDPDFTVPGQGRPIKIKDGPEAPPREPPNDNVRSDGTVPQGTPETNGLIVPYQMENHSFFRRWAQPTKDFLGWFAREYKAVTGKESNLVKRWVKVLEKRQAADRIADLYISEIEKAAKARKVPMTRQNGNSIGKYRRALDDVLETDRQMRLASGESPESIVAGQKANLDKIMGEVRAKQEAGGNILTDAEFALQKDLLDIKDRFYEFLGLDPNEYRVGYYQRRRQYARYFYDKKFHDSIYNRGMTLHEWYAQEIRHREEAANLDTLAKAIDDRTYQEILQMEHMGNFWDEEFAYIRGGTRRKVAGEAMRDLQLEFGEFSDANGANLLLIGGDVLAGKDLASRLTRDIEALFQLPNDRQLQAESRRREKLKRLAYRLKDWTETLEKTPVPEAVTKAMTRMYKNLGIAAHEGHVNSWLDIFARMHRGQTFGFNVMASVRDMVSTGIFSYLHHTHADFAQGMKVLWDGVANRKSFTARLEDVLARNLVDLNAYPELAEQGFLGRFSALRIADQVSWLYRKTDLLSKLIETAASDHATERAYKRFSESPKKEKDWHDFLEETGLDLASEAFTDVTKERLMRAVDSGSIMDLKNLVARVNVGETAMWFGRYNSAPYMDFAVGRAFGMYGSWPLHAMNAMWNKAMGPYRHYGNDRSRAVRRSLELGAKFALAAEATYAIGAAMNINSADWIPFLHNTMPTGGPLTTAFENTRQLLAGDPQTLQRFEKNPTKYILTQARLNIPIPGFGAFRRLSSQWFPPDDVQHARLLGMPRPMDEWWDRTIVTLGFTPWNKPLYKNFAAQGLLQRMEARTIGRVQDMIAEGVGAEDWLRGTKP